MSEELDSVVRVVFTNGEENCLALIVGSYEAPTFTLVAKDGHRFTWLQSLCRGAPPDREAEYWKARALAAEAKVELAEVMKLGDPKR